MTTLWLKTFHLFFMVAWFAGIFYLPRLFVYHAETDNQAVRDQFKVMERRLWLFVTPFALLTLVFGVMLIYTYGYAWFAASTWLHVKIVLVTAIYGYHFYLWYLVKQFANDRIQHSARYFRVLNEAPVLVLLLVIALAVVKFI